MSAPYDFDPLLYPAPGESLVWVMQNAEKAALVQVLRISRPEAALEIGTCNGGSLRQIQAVARKTYSIDIDPQVRERLAGQMPGVTFLTGDSRALIPEVLAACRAAGTPLNFVLVDGDHRYQGVKGDLNALLAYQPSAPLWILMHDSSNPECRRGIADADWAANPHVHAVELDFVAGSFSPDEDFHRQLWGGLALALLLPEPRPGALKISASLAQHFDRVYRQSIDYPSVANTVRYWARIKWRGLRRRLKRGGSDIRSAP
jgi:cephalosporin hydroxylase